MRTIALGGMLAGLGYWFWRYLMPQHSSLVLENKVVVVTGASSGLGAALATAFARRGATVVLVARREAMLQDVEKRLVPYAAETLIIPADLTDPAQQQHMVEKVQSHFGRIDVLVNCAGVSGGNRFEDSDMNRNQQIMNVNMNAVVALTRLVLPDMVARNQGYIVNVGSVAGYMPAPGYAAYSATKAGLRGFSLALNRELQGRDIHVLYAAPGWMRSEMLLPEAEAILHKLPQHSVASTETVAEEIVDALVQGRQVVISTGTIERFGIWIEIHFPRLNDLYWFVVTRYQPWYEMVRKTG